MSPAADSFYRAGTAKAPSRFHVVNSTLTGRYLPAIRLGEAPALARRVLGLRHLKSERFKPGLSAEEALRLMALSRRARGDGRVPAIFVLGVMPRSGTNFLRDLIALHPNVYPESPGQLHEFPLLHAAGGMRAFMDEFVVMFPRNAEVLRPWDALAMLAGAWLHELQAEAGPRHMLLKSPHVHHLSLFPAIFPDDKAIICLRDGRDVIDSSLKTFKGHRLMRKTFGQLAWEWRLGTEVILDFTDGGSARHENVMVVRYEDLASRTEDTMARVLAHLGLSSDRFDFDQARSLPVRGSSRSTADDGDRWKPQARDASFQPVARWTAWNDARKRRFDRIAGDVARRAGYDASL